MRTWCLRLSDFLGKSFSAPKLSNFPRANLFPLVEHLLSSEEREDLPQNHEGLLKDFQDFTVVGCKQFLFLL